MTVRKGDDTDLLSGLKQGDRAAVATVYRRHNTAMVRVAAAILRNHASGEEVAQETWLSVLRNIASFEGRSSLAGWIFTILTNKARTRARRDGRSVSLDTSATDDSLDDAFDAHGHWKDLPELWDTVTPERVVAGRQMMDHANAAIEALPPAQHAVLVLRGQQGLDLAEVAAILEITEGNARVTLHRARMALRKAMDRVLTA